MIVQIELLMQKSQFNFIMKGQGNSQKKNCNELFYVALFYDKKQRKNKCINNCNEKIMY